MPNGYGDGPLKTTTDEQWTTLPTSEAGGLQCAERGRILARAMPQEPLAQAHLEMLNGYDLATHGQLCERPTSGRAQRFMPITEPVCRATPPTHLYRRTRGEHRDGGREWSPIAAKCVFAAGVNAQILCRVRVDYSSWPSRASIALLAPSSGSEPPPWADETPTKSDDHVAPRRMLLADLRA